MELFGGKETSSKLMTTGLAWAAFEPRQRIVAIVANVFQIMWNASFILLF
jgi:hypothetical protein